MPCGAATPARAPAAPAAPVAPSCSPTAAPDPRIPTWQAVSGYDLGYREATNEELSTYIDAVAAASPRVHAGTLGRSVEGRPLRYALVSDPRNLTPAALRTEQRQLAALATGRPRGEALRRALQTIHPTVWITGSVHSDEPSGADADMRVLHDLAAGTDCTSRARLRRVIVVLLPDQNPDGRAAGTRVSGAGFDLNRDYVASTQPETTAKLALMRRLPPTVLGDQHEQPGSSFFFPPYSNPIHHEIAGETRAAIADVVSPALVRAFDAAGIAHTSYGAYDLFYPGYEDSAATLIHGAAGMTFEAGADNPYPVRVQAHALAATTTIDAAAANASELARAWAASWRSARAQGAAGAVAPDTVVPATPVYGYALRAGGDAARLVQRLTSAGVQVRTLRRALHTSVRAYGTTAAVPTTLAPGTFLVALEQGAKHWAETMLDDQSYPPFPYFYDVTSWSQPLLMGLEGGAIVSPLPAGVRGSRRATAPTTTPALAPATSYSFAGASQASAELASALLRAGVAVSRAPDPARFAQHPGDYLVAGSARAKLAELAPRFDTAPAPQAEPVPAGLPALAPPSVAIYSPAGAPAPVRFDFQRGEPALSPAWARYLLSRRLGLDAATLSAAEIERGALAGRTALVVAEGPDSGPLIPGAAALAQLRDWVSRGGVYVGIRRQGLAVARAAALTGATSPPSPETLRLPGAAIRIALDGSDPLAWGEHAAYCMDNQDPLLSPGPASRVVGRYPAKPEAFYSGYVEGTAALEDTAAVLDDPFGSGHVVLFSCDPDFRGYTDGTERLLAAALLYPRTS